MTQDPPLPDETPDVLFSDSHYALRQWRAAHPRATFDDIEGGNRRRDAAGACPSRGGGGAGRAGERARPLARVAGWW